MELGTAILVIIACWLVIDFRKHKRELEDHQAKTLQEELDHQRRIELKGCDHDWHMIGTPNHLLGEEFRDKPDRWRCEKCGKEEFW
jgi:hypothetical protein